MSSNSMHKVRTTNASKRYRIKIKELGRIANPGEVFEVSEQRYEILSGHNRYKLKFVVECSDPITVVAKSKIKVEKLETECLNKSSENLPVHEDVYPQISSLGALEEMESPKIFLIEPGKEPVEVDCNLQPIADSK